MQKGGLEIVYNLEWKNKICYGEETSNMVGIVDDPANALDYETFKTYLLKNSGSSLGIDNVRVSFNKNGQQHFIDTPGAFERALSTFRRRAKAGKVTTLILEYVNPIYVTKQCDVHTQVDQDQKNPPEWFTTYMIKFKEDLIKEISANVSVKINKSKDPVKEVASSCKVRDKSVYRTAAKTDGKVARGNLSSVMNKSTVKVQNSKSGPKGIISACKELDKDKILNLVTPHEHGSETAVKTGTLKDGINRARLPNSISFLTPLPKESNIWKEDIDLVTVLTFPAEDVYDFYLPARSPKKKAQRSSTDAKTIASNIIDNCLVTVKTDIKREVPSPPSNKPANLKGGTTSKGQNSLDIDFVNCNQLQKSRMHGGGDHKFDWGIKNTGNIDWTEQIHVRYAWGSEELIPHLNRIQCPRLKVGEVGAITVDVKLPVSPGKYMCHFKFYNRDEIFGKWFGIEVTIDRPPGLNPQCVRKPIYDVITIHDAYELVLPSTWTTPPKTLKKVLEPLKLYKESIVQQELPGHSPPATKKDSTNPGTTNVTEINTQVKEVYDSESLVYMLKMALTPQPTNQEPEKLIERNVTNKSDGKDETCDKTEIVPPKAENDSSDDDQSIISIPESIPSNTSEEFVHVKLTSPDVSNAQDLSESENILEEFDELDDFPKVEIVLSNDVTHQLDDAINDNSEEKPSRPSEELDNLETGSSNSAEEVSTPSQTSDSSSDLAYVIYNGKKVPVAKKYLREDYLATAEKVPLACVESIDEHETDDCMAAERPISSSIEFDCSFLSVPKSANSCTKNPSIKYTDMENLAGADCANSSKARVCSGYFEPLHTSDTTKPKDNNITTAGIYRKEDIIGNTIFPKYKPGASHASSQTSVLSSDEMTAGKTETENPKSNSTSQIPCTSAPTAKFAPPLPSPDDQLEVFEYIPPESTPCTRSKPETTVNNSKQCNTGTQYGNTPIGYDQPFLSNLKRKIGKFKKGLSSSITEVVGILPDLLDDAKADGYWRNGEWVSTNPMTNRGLALNMLHEMGFQNRWYNEALLVRYNNDLNKVVTELLSYLK